MIRHLISLLFLACLCHHGFCQDKKFDSLFLVLKSAEEDSNKVKALNALSNKYWIIDSCEKGKLYGEKAVSLAEKINYKKGEAAGYLNIGLNLQARFDYANAITNYETALKIFTEIDDKRNICWAYFYIGRCYDYQDYYPEALKNYYEALKTSEALQNKFLTADIASAMAGAYANQENYPEAVKNFETALKFYKEAGNKKSAGRCYYTLCEIYLLQDNVAEALKNDSSGYKLSVELNDERGFAWFYNNLGRIRAKEGELALAKDEKELAKNKFNEAIKDHLSALTWYHKFNNDFGKSNAYLYLGRAYGKIGDFTNAKKYLDSCLNLSGVMKEKYNMRESYFTLASLDSAKQNYEGALRNYQLYIFYRDSIINEENARRSFQTKLQYDFGKKEDSLKQKQTLTQATLAGQQKQKNYYLGGSILLAILSIFVYLNFRNQKKINRLMDDAHAKEKAELELQSLRAQLNPHFMFNSLNAIQELILKEENEKSQSYLARFAKLLRMLLENADKPFIPLQREIDFLQLYLALENLRIPDLQFSIDVDQPVDTEKTMIPNMILQPYIENAIWHGLSHKESDRRLQMRISQLNETTQYEIEDNGIGRKKAAELKSLYRKEHKSKGMELLSKRFRLLAKEYGSDIETTVTDLVSNDDVIGTTVIIKVPLTFSGSKKSK